MQQGDWAPVPPSATRAHIPHARPQVVSTAWILLAGAILTAGFLYPLAVSFIDQRHPQTGAAALLLILIVLTWVPAVYGTRLAYPETWSRLLLIALGAAGPVAILTVFLQEQSYGFLGFLGIIFWVGLPVAAIGVVALFAALIQRLTRHGAAAIRTVHLLGLWILGVAGMTATWLLLTMPRQARLAREAHEATGLALLVFLAVLLAFLAVRRRS